MNSDETIHRKLTRQQLDSFFTLLHDRGYITIAPTRQNGAIVLDAIRTCDELPVGWTEEQTNGTYRIKQRKDSALFGYTVGAHSWKRYLHPPVVQLWQSKRNGKRFDIKKDGKEPPRLAFVGVRSCDLHAIAILDKVFLEGPYVDVEYKRRRANVFIVAVNCTEAGGTCFCTSMQTGPKAIRGFDLALTEVINTNEHFFIVEIGSERGDEIMTKTKCESANENDVHAAERAVASTAAWMNRSVNMEGLPVDLYKNLEHPRWSDVGKRCLTCANCTMVCPTCFCTTVEDTTDLTGRSAERVRRWDSCFTMDFSYIHGGSVRSSVQARYRQWLMHKFASWKQQFGTFGCVGCGRCITWCPVGIDVTEEIRAIRKSEQTQPSTISVKE